MNKLIQNDYILDKEESIRLYKKHQSFLRPKECYHNVHQVLMYELSTFEENGWCVAYGYWEVLPNIMARHCFIVTKENKVIDPTLPLIESKMKSETHPYWSFVVMDTDTYYKNLEKANWKPCMDRLYFKQEKKIEQSALESGIAVLS